MYQKAFQLLYRLSTEELPADTFLHEVGQFLFANSSIISFRLYFPLLTGQWLRYHYRRPQKIEKALVPAQSFEASGMPQSSNPLWVGHWQGEHLLGAICLQFRGGQAPAQEEKTFLEQFCPMAFRDFPRPSSERQQPWPHISKRMIFRLIEDVPFQIFLKNPNGHFIYVNKAVAALHGLRRRDILGKRDEDLITNREHLAKYQADDRSVSQQGKEIFDAEEPQYDYRGRLRQNLVMKLPVDFGESGRYGIAGAAAQVTERVAAQKALYQQKQLLTRVLDALPLNVYLKDAQGRFTMVNRSTTQTIGKTKGQFLGNTYRQVFDPEPAERIEKLDQGVLKRGQAIQWEEQITDAQNRQRLFFAGRIPLQLGENGEPQVLGYSLDITERKEAEERQKQQEQFIRAALDTNPHLIGVISQAGRLRLANKALANALGTTKEMLENQEVAAFLRNPEDLQRMTASNEKVLASGNPLEYKEKMTLPGGAIRWYFTSKRPLLHNNQAPEVLSVSTDITALIKTQEELMEAKRQSERDKAAKDRFLANLSHELRTPLNGILGFTNLLSETALSPHQQETLGAIQSASEELLQIINQMLDFAQIESGEIRFNAAPFSFQELWAGLEAGYSAMAQQKGLQLYFTSDPELRNCWLRYDPLRLRQMLQHLLENALKFTGQGSIALNAKISNDWQRLMLQVKDTGPGIPKAQQAAIFERFSQLDDSNSRRHGGTGLGLSIVKSLAELQGGALTLASQPGVGSTFTLELPLQLATPPKQTSGEDQSKQEASLSGRNILVAEDNILNQRLLQRLLESWQARVSLAKDGQEALKQLADAPFDLLLLDLQMPVMDGFEVARYVRSTLGYSPAQLPLIAITANATQNNQEQAYLQGFDDFISKPFQPDALKSLIIKHLQHPKNTESPAKGASAPTGEHLEKHQKVVDLSYLKVFCEGDEAFMQEMTQVFVLQVQEDLPLIWQAFHAGQLQEVSNRVHKLKTSIHFMGIRAINDELKTCEQLALEGIRELGMES